jgi:hypothetical protein
MKMKRLFFIWCIASCMLCFVLGLYAWRQKCRTIEQAGVSATAHANAQQRQANLRRQIAAAEEEQKAGRAKLPGKKPKKPTELSDKERYDLMMVNSDAENQNIVLQAHRRSSMRRQYQEQYGDLYTELNLPPQKLERFKQLLVEEFEAHSDAAALVATHGVSNFSPAGKSATEQAQQMVEHDIESLLGEKDYATYREYDRVSRDISRLHSFQGALAEKNKPTLDKTQLRALATACCDVADNERNPDYAAIAKDLGGATATQQIVQRVTSQLTPEQIRAFIAYREESDTAQKASEAFIRGEAPLPPPRKLL